MAPNAAATSWAGSVPWPPVAIAAPRMASQTVGMNMPSDVAQNTCFFEYFGLTKRG